MNIKVTKKAVIEGCPRVIGIPYCAAQTLLSGCEPVAYIDRPEGWAADVYLFPKFNAAIVTGYAPFGNIDMSKDRERMEYFNAAARKLVSKATTAADARDAVNGLLDDFVAVVCNDAACGVYD